MKFFLTLLILLTLNLYAKDEIRFGVYAYRGYEDTKKRYDPLVKHLNETLDKKVIMEVLSQDEMNKKVAAKELDIVTTSPIHFLLLRHDHKLSGAIATLVGMYDDNIHTNKFAGVIVVRKDSSIKTLGDIKDKVVATPNINLLGGFRAQAYELHKVGIDILKESKDIRQLNSGYKTVIKDVLEGRADVGFTRDGIVEQMVKAGEIKADEMRIINEKSHKNYPFKTSTPLYPEWPIFALPHADEDDVKDFVSALFLLKPTSEHAKESKIYGYSLAADYLETEELTRELRLPPFDRAPQITLSDIWERYKYALISALAAFLMILFFYIEAQRKKRFAESLLTNMADGVYGVDESGNCTWINQRALDMLGFKKEEVLHKNQHTLFHHHKPSNEIYNADDCPITKTLQDRKNREDEEFFIKKDGSFFPVELSVASIEGNGAIVIFRDITQKRALKNALLQEKVKAEEANSAKSQFLANMSHEIRTPMNAVIGLNKLLLDTALNERQKDLVLKIENSSKMLLSIINDILDYSKIEANKLELENIPFELESIFSQLKVMFSSTAYNKELELYFHIKQGVANLIIGDKLRLSQVLTNLLSNALKFTHHGTIIFEVELKKKIDENHALLAFSINDTGIGMSKEQLEKLFSPFTQADNSTTRKYGGTGLGLTISKRIIGAMGGDLSVSSIEGVGTTFSFEIEVGVASWDAEVDIKQNELNKVLIVDDQEISREILKDILLRFGCICDEAKDGKEALLMIKEADKKGRAYKVILMDWLMPELDGKETIKKIHEMIKNGELSSKSPTILMVSAHSQEKVNPFDVDIEGFLSKPVTSSTLFDALSNVKESRFKKPDSLEQEELPDFSPITVLLIEDNEINQEVASMMLQRVGISVDIANNGKEGVERYLANRDKYDLIFMDLHMPVMNGYEASREIRLHDKDIPIIALSAAAMVEDVQKAKESGMNDHLGKPIDIDELYKKISIYAKIEMKPKVSNIQKENFKESDAVLDMEYLEKNFSSKELINKLLGKFLQELKGEFKDIASLVEHDDESAPLVIHALKGLSGNLRANELFGICQKIDTKLKSKEIVKKEDIELLKSSMKRVETLLASLHLKDDTIEFEKLSKDELRELFFEIRDGLLHGNIIKTLQYKTLLANLKNSINQAELDSFDALMDDLEYESALEIMDGWRV